MKPLLFKNPKTEKESFYLQEDRLPHFYDVLHYHPELQLTALISGTGTRFIGDTIGSFKPGEVLLIGSNLPHVLRSDPEYYDRRRKLLSHSVSAYFRKESFGDTFFDLPEMLPISELFNRSSRGLLFSDKTAAAAWPKIIALKNTSGFERVTALLEVLNLLSQAKNFEYISSVAYHTPQRDFDSKKINDVFDYVMSNFSKEIRLDDVAEVARMSPTAFCRYFKLRTRKIFSRFLNEVRIGHACKLLLTGRFNISEVCWMSGYNNISNFNRQFKTIMNMTPKEYVRRYGL